MDREAVAPEWPLALSVTPAHPRNRHRKAEAVTFSPDRDAMLHELLSLPPTERDDYLRGQCAGNEDLQEEMRSLLRVHDAHADRLRLEDSDSLPGSIGRYPVLQLLGRGGMGTVYLGVDPELERKIAIKVVSKELSTHLSIER